MRGRPIFTLFPYTTLFRSVEQVGRIEIGDAATAAAGQRARKGDEDGQRDQAFRSAHGNQLFATGGSRACSASARERRPDRKSTRLNSSHRCISYAVFRLKK